MRVRKRFKRPDDLISAQEMACFSYCPEQWRLRYRLWLKSSNGDLLDIGDRFHGRLVIAERAAGGAITFGRWVAFLASLFLLGWIWWRP